MANAATALQDFDDFVEVHALQDFDDFVEVHALLLAASGIPQSLHHQLFKKLSSETFDGGRFFQIEPCHNGRQRRLVLASEHMVKESQVFLIDHAWTFRLPDAYTKLREVPGLAQRMASLMCIEVDLTSMSKSIDDFSESSPKNSTTLKVEDILECELQKVRESEDDFGSWLELDDLNIDDTTLLSLDLSSKFPNLVALSLCQNNIKSGDIIKSEINKFKHLRALWLNDNPLPLESHGFMEDEIIKVAPRLEIYNSYFTRNFNVWALGFCGGIIGKDIANNVHQTNHPLQNVTSLDLSDRSIHKLSIQTFSPAEMPCLSHLNLRGNPFDQNSVSDLLVLLKRFTCLHSLEVDIPGPIGQSSLEILGSLHSLSLLNGVTASKILEAQRHVLGSMLQPRLPEWTSEEPLLDRVINAMWLFLMSYRLADEEKIDETSVWYVMDELGSALRHSDTPNFRVSPFLYLPSGKLESALSFTILWPIQNVGLGDECTRDFLFGFGEVKQRTARLATWFHLPKYFFIQEYHRYCQNLRSETLASPFTLCSSTKSLKRDDGCALRVYMDVPHVGELLTRPDFIITMEPKNADIIWTSMQIDEDTRKAAGITHQPYINQFPYEACLVMKHHLAETIQKVHGVPEWFQPTYNLETQLCQLIGDYVIRERGGLNNLWILKPWNMARTIDTTVTGDLSAILRLMETGPKICQKYIELPCLFTGKKFDLRYIVLVRSMNPLEIFIFDVFWVRLANNTYSLEKSTLLDYETHFTVMNYCGRLNHINSWEFVKEFEQKHQVKWLDIHCRIAKMIRLVFESATIGHPEMQCSSSRAIYGVDVMLDSFYQPKLLEVTYCPDCARACTYDMRTVFGVGETIKGGDFFNLVFGCLFLNETTHVSAL